MRISRDRDLVHQQARIGLTQFRPVAVKSVSEELADPCDFLGRLTVVRDFNSINPVIGEVTAGAELIWGR